MSHSTVDINFLKFMSRFAESNSVVIGITYFRIYENNWVVIGQQVVQI